MFGITPQAIEALGAKADAFLLELRRLNENLEAIRRDGVQVQGTVEASAARDLEAERS